MIINNLLHMQLFQLAEWLTLPVLITAGMISILFLANK